MLSHFDHSFTPGKEYLDENKVKQFVAEAFNNVQEDDVFAVCGKWVLNAYLLKKQPNDSDSQLVVRRAYEDYMLNTEGSSSVSKQNHMIDTILKIGGVQVLETRYSMINTPFQYNETLFRKYHPNTKPTSSQITLLLNQTHI